MKCPYCNEEMKSGYLQSSRPFFWGKNKTTTGIFLPVEESDVKVSKGFVFGCFAPSDYCPACKKIITSVPEKE